MTVQYYGPGDAKAVFEALVSSPPTAISIDVETVSFADWHILGFSIALSPTMAFYFQCDPEPPRELELIKPLLANPMVTKVFHNAPFDLRMFPGVPVVGWLIDRTNIWDTAVASRLLGNEFNTLTDLAPIVGMEAEGAKSVMAKYAAKDMRGVPPEVLASKCANDAMVTSALYAKFYPKVMAQYAEYFRVEMGVIPVLIDMGSKGIKIDHRKRKEIEDRLEKEIYFYEKIIRAAGIEKPGSPQQVGYMLATRGNFLPFTRGKRKQLATGEGILEFLTDPLAAAVLQYRHYTKLQSSYIKPIAEDERFYTEYSLDTSVFRISSANRNIQNIPGLGAPINVREILIPDSGTFTTFDWSQMHLYILAHQSGDSQMQQVYENPDPEKRDIHQHTADFMRINRKLAKTINYAVIYGATAQTLMEQAKTRDYALCQNLLDGWFRVYRQAAGWIKDVQREGLRTGWSFPTIFNRTIRLPVESEDGMKRKAVNYPILGSDGEVMKRGLLLCCRRGLAPPCLSITVHDSGTFDGDVELPVEKLENLTPFRIPIKVEKTTCWS